MGIWEVIGSTTEAVKRNSPDLTPPRNASKASYDYVYAACGTIDQTARTNFHCLTEWMPGNETIGLCASILAKHTRDYALQEGCNWIPGGVAVRKIVLPAIKDYKAGKFQASSQDNVVTPSSGGRNLVDGPEVLGGGGQGMVSNLEYHLDFAAKKTPEDVIRIFMMKDFFGARFLDNLMVPTVRGRKKSP